MSSGKIESTLLDELTQLDQLLVLLKKEQKLLTERRLDELLPLLDEKTILIRRLEECSQARRQAFESEQVTDQADTIRSWLHVHQPTLQQQWEQLLENARAAELINRTNGQLINTRQEIEQQFLQQSVMPNSAESSSYTADGRINPLGNNARRRDLA